MRLRSLFIPLAVLLTASPAIEAGPSRPRAREERSPTVLKAMGEELERSRGALKTQRLPPYFLSYAITDTQTVWVGGGFGVLMHRTDSRRRLLDVDVRVGDYTLDNTRALRGAGMFSSFDRFSFVEIPIDDSPDAIRAVLWYQTDRKYKRALEQLTAVETNVRVKVEQEDKSADFSKEPAVTAVEKPV